MDGDKTSACLRASKNIDSLKLFGERQLFLTQTQQSSVPLQVVDRAKQEDLQHPQKYLVTFMRNNRGQVIIDRRFNTSQLVSMYLNHPVPEDVIAWNPDNPNQLKMNIPGTQTQPFLRAAVPPYHHGNMALHKHALCMHCALHEAESF